MTLPNNLTLFDECLEHPEPLIDPFYCHESRLISDSVNASATPVMTANKELLDRITAAAIALDDDDIATYDRCIDRIAILLRQPNMNFTEFTSFFPVLDVSFSMFSNLGHDVQRDFLKQAVRLYIAKRHSVYASHGYTATTIQVRKDFEKHKTEGSAGARKAASLLETHGYSEHGDAPFEPGLQTYVFANLGAAATRALDHMRNRHRLAFEWQRHHQDKSADLYLSHPTGQIFICELKHVKEGGGGQHKQVVELISLISHSEVTRHIRYIAFLDGMYFNEFIQPRAPKIVEQARQIRTHLKSNPGNYFVNTYGLKKILACRR